MSRPIDQERKIYLDKLNLTSKQARKIGLIQLSRLCAMDEASRNLVLPALLRAADGIERERR